jgi:hypothetical protein
MTAEITSGSAQPPLPSAKFDQTSGAVHSVFGKFNTWWVVAALTTCLLVVAVMWLFLDGHVDNWMHQRSFDAALWKADIWDKTTKRYVYGGDWPPRLCMVDGLMASKRLLGMTKGEVVELLGPADQQTDVVGNRQRSIAPRFTYYLGPERGFIRIDSETLILEFDANGKVTRQFIYRD